MSSGHHTHHESDYIEFEVTDMAEAQRFYGAAFGWTFNDYGPGYAGIQKSDDGEAGGLRLGSGAGHVPQGFEKAAAAVGSARPPTALNSVGRILMSSSSGDLWIDRRRPRPFTREQQFGAAGGTMDVFDSAGRGLGRAVIPDGVKIQGIGNSVAVGIRFSELDEVTVVAYRIIR